MTTPERALRHDEIDWKHEGVQGSHLTGNTSVSLRSSGDLMLRDNSTQALWEIRRCATEADYASWARKWGEAAILTIEGIRR